YVRLAPRQHRRLGAPGALSAAEPDSVRSGGRRRTRARDSHAGGMGGRQRRRLSSSAYSSVTAGDRRNDAAPAPALVMERLRDGPVPELLNPGTGSSSVWSIGGRLRTPAAGASFRQQFMAGADVEGDAARVRPAFSGMVGETLDGIPAHVWQFTAPESASRWTSTIVS